MLSNIQKIQQAALATLLAIALVLPVGGLSVAHAQAPGAVWKRVVDSGRIRCAYISYEPYVIKDPNTKALSGLAVEAAEAIAKKLDLKLDWVEEVGYGTMLEGLETNRYDLICSGIWQNAVRSKRAYFTVPMFFNAIRVWVRADETRFQKLADLNASSVRIGVQDRAIEDVIAEQDFPKAQRVSIPQFNAWPEVLLNIITKKADVTFAEVGVVAPFLAKNPGTLKELPAARPIRVFATSLPLKMGENEFRSALDGAIQESLADGTMESILSKYEKVPGELLRVAPPFEETKK